MTATVSSRFTAPVLIAAPKPAITPQPNNPATAGSASGSTSCTGLVHQRLVDERADAQRGVSSVPSVNVIFSAALNVSKHKWGPPLTRPACPHTARQFRITKSPGATFVTPSPTDSTLPAASWPSRKGNSSLMPPSR